MGWFEVYFSDGEETPEKREFARRLDALLKSFGKFNTFPLRTFFNDNVRRSQPHQSILHLRASRTAERAGLSWQGNQST